VPAWRSAIPLAAEMRLFLGLLLMLAAASTAAADDRFVPAAGTTLTFRLMTVTKSADRTVTVGQIYNYVIASSDGAIAEGTIKPLALIYGCGGHETERDCAAALKAPGAKQEGDLVTVPVPPDIADELTKLSALKFHYFIIQERKIAMPGTKDPKADAGEFGHDLVFVLSVGMECDGATLKGFLPFGRTAMLTVPCKQTISRTPGPGTPLSPFQSTHDVAMELTDKGSGHVTVPAGDFDVRRLTLKESASTPTQTDIDGTIDFSTKLGVAVKTHSIVTPRTSQGIVVQSDSELIAVAP